MEEAIKGKNTKSNTQVYDFKNSWHEIIKYLDLADMFNLELVNRDLREKINNVYIQRNAKNNVNIGDKYKINKRVNKKKFFEYYMNAFIAFDVEENEFANEIDKAKEDDEVEYPSNSSSKKKDKDKEKEREKNQDKEKEKESKDAKKQQKLHLKVMDELVTSKNHDKRIFTENIQEMIYLRNERVLILYTNGMVRFYTVSSKGFLVFKMQFHPLIDKRIKEIAYADDKGVVLCLDEAGNMYYFKDPEFEEKQTGTAESFKVNKVDLNIYINHLFYIKKFIIIFDNEHKSYFILIDELCADSAASIEGSNVLTPNLFGKTEEETKTSCENTDAAKEGESISSKEELSKSVSDISVSSECLSVSGKKKKVSIFAFSKNYSIPTKFSYNEFYLMFSDEKLNLFNISTMDLEKFNVTEFKPISDVKVSNITQIALGDKYWFILDREDIPPLDSWSFEEVGNWFSRLKLEDYLNIIKYEKITGRDILNADETFFLNVIGMTNEEIKKIMYERELVKETTCIQAKLYAWGNNKSGQLGLTGNIFYKTAVQVPLPELKNQTDYIDKVIVGKENSKFSILVSKFGEAFITGNYDLKTKIANTPKEVKEKKPNTSASAKTNTAIVKWQNITNEVSFHEKKNVEFFFKVKNVITMRNRVFFFGYKSYVPPFTLLLKKPKQKHCKSGERFPLADQVIDRIFKNCRSSISDKDRYFIVWADAVLGILESSLEEFQKNEVQYHRIIQIKYFKEVIWDRKKRYFKFIE